jgi:DNA-binding NtrC family response regulator
MKSLSVLIIDDEMLFSREVAEFLKSMNYKVFVVNHPVDGLAMLEKHDINLILLDIKMPEMDGITVLQKVKESHPNVEVIMITGHGNMDSVIDALRLGALDYLIKPFGKFEIQSSIERSKRFIALSDNYLKVKDNFAAASKELKEKFGNEIIGTSESIQNVVNLMYKVSKTDDTSVLITGESGTGKELVARGIHELSSRKDSYFFDVNCSSIPESLFESEFFGHTRGSFTGAFKEKAGWFEVANKGTLFLDEIGDMPVNQQIKLLRVLEQRKIRRVGSSKDISVDVRIITATNHDLATLVQENKFRLDLYHRLRTYSINLDPLRERKSDIPPLLKYFVHEFSRKMRKKTTKIDEKAIEMLTNYSFPGNVRELKNLVERAIIVSDTEKLIISDFELNVFDKTENEFPEMYDLDEIEKSTILKVLKFAKYKSQAAKMLNITVQSLDRRIKKYNLETKF